MAATTIATLWALLMAAPLNTPVCVAARGAAQECAVKTTREVTFLSCVRTGAHQQICNKR